MTFTLQRCISISLLILSTSHAPTAAFKQERKRPRMNLLSSLPGDLPIEKLRQNPSRPSKEPNFAEKMRQSFQFQSAHNDVYVKVPHIPQPRLGKKDSEKEEYEPLRILFSTSHLESLRQTSTATNVQIDSIIDSILPETDRIWSSYLSVIPRTNPIDVEADTCSEEAVIPAEFISHGVNNTDLVIFVNGVDCAGSGALAYAFPCALDTYNDRPLIGNMYFCLDSISVTDGKVPPSMIKNTIEIAVHELGHILGINSDLLPYFRSSDNDPLTPRPLQPINVTCVDGTRREIVLPANNTLKAVSSGKIRHFEIVTEKVKIVVRNQFNCPTLEGARLENQPTNPYDCFGSHWDERHFYTESLGAVYAEADNSNILSPLTLALLEDTGWYKANYENCTISSFGHIAGCEFVNNDCIVNGQVPSYSDGFYCNKPLEIENGSIRGNYSMCDPTHTNVALCDLVNHGILENRSMPPPKEFRYFPDPNFGPISMKQADYCPMASIYFHSCQGQPQAIAQSFETFGPNSNCIDFEYSIGGQSQETGVCLETKCDTESQTLNVVLKGVAEVLTCTSDGQKIQIPGVPDIYFKCPRLAVVCPNMICPANCSGRGICDHSEKKPKCKCFDERDRTSGCYNYDPNETIPPMQNPTSSPSFADNTGSLALNSLTSRVIISSVASVVGLLLVS